MDYIYIYGWYGFALIILFWLLQLNALETLKWPSWFMQLGFVVAHLETWQEQEEEKAEKHRQKLRPGRSTENGFKPSELEVSPKKVNLNWLVVSNIWYFHPYLGKWSNMTNIFQIGWDHQPDFGILQEEATPWWKSPTTKHVFWKNMGRPNGSWNGVYDDILPPNKLTWNLKITGISSSKWKLSGLYLFLKA